MLCDMVNSNKDSKQLKAVIVDRIPEIPRKASASRWAGVKSAVLSAPDGKWVHVALPESEDGRKSRRLVLGTLRAARTGLKLECKYDRFAHTLYIRRKIDQ